MVLRLGFLWCSVEEGQNLPFLISLRYQLVGYTQADSCDLSDWVLRLIRPKKLLAFGWRRICQCLVLVCLGTFVTRNYEAALTRFRILQINTPYLFKVFIRKGALGLEGRAIVWKNALRSLHIWFILIMSLGNRVVFCNQENFTDHAIPWYDNIER